MPFIWQACLMAAAIALVVGVHHTRRLEPITRREVVDAALGICSVVLIFAFLTGGRGCSALTGAGLECDPSPNGPICSN